MDSAHFSETVNNADEGNKSQGIVASVSDQPVSDAVEESTVNSVVAVQVNKNVSSATSSNVLSAEDLDRRLRMLESSNARNTFNFSGFDKTKGESDLTICTRFLKEVLGMRVRSYTIMKCNGYGFDRTGIKGSIKFTVPQSISEEIGTKIYGKNSQLYEYNKRNNLKVIVNKELTKTELETMRESKVLAALLRKKLNTEVYSSAMNFKLRIGKESKDWLSLEVVKRSHPDLLEALRSTLASKNSISVRGGVKRNTMDVSYMLDYNLGARPPKASRR